MLKIRCLIQYIFNFQSKKTFNNEEIIFIVKVLCVTFFCTVNKIIKQSHVIMKKLTEKKAITEFTKNQISADHADVVKGGNIIIQDTLAG